MAAAQELEGVQLLIGVLSFHSPTALARRVAMRQFTSNHSGAVALRFVMASSEPDADADAADVWNLTVVENTRAIGVYLLTNAFFRRACGLRPLVSFIGRADDDAYFDPDTVLIELRIAQQYWRAHGPADVVYGFFNQW